MFGYAARNVHLDQENILVSAKDLTNENNASKRELIMKSKPLFIANCSISFLV